jgi:hypothetical protein
LKPWHNSGFSLSVSFCTVATQTPVTTNGDYQSEKIEEYFGIIDDVCQSERISNSDFVEALAFFELICEVLSGLDEKQQKLSIDSVRIQDEGKKSADGLDEIPF